MEEIIVWLVHTPAGTVALVAATVALFSKKGAALHRKAGIWFTVSMLVMLIAGFVAGLLKESPGDMLLSAVVMYTVFTAWLTTHHKMDETGFLEQVALAWIATVAIAAFFLNVVGLEAGTPNIYLFWGGFAAFCAIGDLRNLYLAGLSGIQRVIRHVWRVGFSLIWTALALTDKIVKSQGSNVKELPEEQLLYIVGIPTILILIPISFWIINILFFSRKKFSGYGHQDK